MAFYFGIFVLLLFGSGALLLLALARWLVLVGITVLYCVGLSALTIGGIAGFGLFQVLGAGYGPLVVAVAITAGLSSAVLMLQRIAIEIGIRPKPLEEKHHAP